MPKRREKEEGTQPGNLGNTYCSRKTRDIRATEEMREKRLLNQVPSGALKARRNKLPPDNRKGYRHLSRARGPGRRKKMKSIETLALAEEAQSRGKNWIRSPAHPQSPLARKGENCSQDSRRVVKIKETLQILRAISGGKVEKPRSQVFKTAEKGDRIEREKAGFGESNHT